MDAFFFLFLSIVSILFGVILTLVVQYYIVYIYFKRSPVASVSKKNHFVDYNIPECLKKQIDENDGDKAKNCSLPVSLILQFLFYELRHSEAIKCWFYKKLSMEFDELLTKTTIGKFFDTIKIKDLHLGNQFPDIKSIVVEDVKLDKKEHIDSINLCLDVDYTGQFLLCIDGKMKFGKTAYLSIKVKRVCGLVRLQFTRIPYTHWSFSFYNDPVIDLAVESHFQGRQLQSNVTHLIVNQIKKAIKRKHTLPNYKIRYKPFFVKTDPSQLDVEDSEILPQGQLEVSCIEVSRLAIPATVQNVYLTLTIDLLPWISIYQKDDNFYMILEITIMKLRQAQLGAIFKQDQGLVIVDSVSPQSLASRSGLKPADIVLAVENKTVNTVPQVAKFVKSATRANITLRVERLVDKYLLRGKNLRIFKSKIDMNINHSEESLSQTDDDMFVLVDKGNDKPTKIVDKLKVVEKRGPTNNENMSKIAQTIGNFSLRKRRTSVSDKNLPEGSAKNTPTSSTPNTPQHSGNFKQTMSIPTMLSKKQHSIAEIPEIVKNDVESIADVSNFVKIHKTEYFNTSSVIFVNEDYLFEVKDGAKYLNINVWGTTVDGNDVLLGYTNIPTNHVLNECCGSVLGHYMRSYSFFPPTNVSPNNQSHPLLSHSGFEHVFCYGDVLMSFVWSHDEEVELKGKAQNASFEEDATIIEHENANVEKHDFIRTQFHRTTHCDFCSKKIWLKDAVQCRKCGLSCHKKCIVKCQSNTGCNPPDKDSLKSETSDILQPEITTTEVADEMTEYEGKPTTSPLKRVNSVNNLSVPGAVVSQTHSKSLPPSPQRTPSRKHSLVAVNPFTMCPTVLEDIKKTPSEAGDSINKLLEQVLLCPADEFLMDAAKETGQQLYNHLSHSEKMEKINLMMTELKKSFDVVMAEHTELTKQMNTEESEVEKTKLAFLLGQADAKVHGLSVLMLHFCSSLQYSQDKII